MLSRKLMERGHDEAVVTSISISHAHIVELMHQRAIYHVRGE